MRGRLAALALAALPAPAMAGNIASCEIVIMEYIEDEAGGGMDVASFRPAAEFLTGVYDADTPLVTRVGERPIRAVLCERADLLPDEDDYAILATGVPFALSQDFDTNQSDSLTLFFKDGRFQYRYASASPMDEGMKAELETRLEDFSAREHGLVDAAGDGDGADEKDVAEPVEEP